MHRWSKTTLDRSTSVRADVIRNAIRSGGVLTRADLSIGHLEKYRGPAAVR